MVRLRKFNQSEPNQHYIFLPRARTKLAQNRGQLQNNPQEDSVGSEEELGVTSQDLKHMSCDRLIRVT